MTISMSDTPPRPKRDRAETLEILNSGFRRMIPHNDALGLEVTAEGVESAEQLASLKGLNCARAQGFYLARPMPAVALRRLVAESHRWQVD